MSASANIIDSPTALDIVNDVSFTELHVGTDFSASELKSQTKVSCEDLKREYEMRVCKITLSEIHGCASCRSLRVDHNDGFDQLVASLEEQGWNSSYLMMVQELGKNKGYRVVDGSHRFVALKLLQARGVLVNCNDERWKIRAMVLHANTPLSVLFRVGADANSSVESHARTPFVQLFKTIDRFRRAETCDGPATSLSNAPTVAKALGCSTRWGASYFREILTVVARISLSVKDELYRLAREHPQRFALQSTQALVMHRTFRQLPPLFQRRALQHFADAEEEVVVAPLMAQLQQQSVLHEYISGKPEGQVTPEKKAILLQQIYDGVYDKLKSRSVNDNTALYAVMDRQIYDTPSAENLVLPIERRLQQQQNPVQMITAVVGAPNLKKRLHARRGQVNLALFDPPFGLTKSTKKTLSHDIIDKVTMHATAALLDMLLDKNRGLAIFSHNFDHRPQWKQVMEHHGFTVSRVPFFAQEASTRPNTFRHNLFRSTVTQWMVVARSLKNIHLAKSFHSTPSCMNNFHSFSRPNYQERVYDAQNGKTLRSEQKSISHLLFFLERFAEPGDLVLDPFMGTGSTGVAALQHGCRFIGIESDAHCAEIAQERLDREQATQAVQQLNEGLPIRHSQKKKRDRSDEEVQGPLKKRHMSELRN